MNSADEKARHLGEEEVAAFLERAGPTEERWATEIHIAHCPDCAALYIAADAISRDLDDHKPPRWPGVWPPVEIALYAIMMVAGAILYPYEFFHRKPPGWVARQ